METSIELTEVATHNNIVMKAKLNEEIYGQSSPWIRLSAYLDDDGTAVVNSTYTAPLTQENLERIKILEIGFFVSIEVMGFEITKISTNASEVDTLRERLDFALASPEQLTKVVSDYLSLNLSDFVVSTESICTTVV